MPDSLIIGGLAVILGLILVLPFLSRKVEEELEIFLFVMGALAAALSGVLGLKLLEKALEEPIPITLAVLVAGFVFRYLQHHIKGLIKRTLRLVPLEVFAFLVVVVLGLLSSVITAIIAALVLVGIINALEIDRRSKVALDVVACFAIGLGAALTPIGEPLATIAISKLEKDFWYLVRLLGAYVVPGIAALGALAAWGMRAAASAARARPSRATAAGLVAGAPLVGARAADGQDTEAPDPVDPWPEGHLPEARLPQEETTVHVILRAAKVYLFVMALVFLGEGFRPLIDRYVLSLGVPVLFWLNSVSAVLDNATLTAAEVSLRMSDLQVRSILLGLLISGGALIPGNIPNIISTAKLKIGSREWARLGVPLGLAIMVIYFVILEVLPYAH